MALCASLFSNAAAASAPSPPLERAICPRSPRDTWRSDYQWLKSCSVQPRPSQNCMSAGDAYWRASPRPALATDKSVPATAIGPIWTIAVLRRVSPRTPPSGWRC
eukprot:6104287-Pyramimonas_sp.AAC.2